MTVHPPILHTCAVPKVGGLKGYDLSKASRKLQMVGKIITSKRWRSVSDHTQFNAQISTILQGLGTSGRQDLSPIPHVRWLLGNDTRH